MIYEANCLGKSGGFSPFERAFVTSFEECGVSFSIYWEDWKFQYPAPSRTWLVETLGM